MAKKKTGKDKGDKKNKKNKAKKTGKGLVANDAVSPSITIVLPFAAPAVAMLQAGVLGVRAFAKGVNGGQVNMVLVDCAFPPAPDQAPDNAPAPDVLDPRFYVATFSGIAGGHSYMLQADITQNPNIVVLDSIPVQT